MAVLDAAAAAQVAAGVPVLVIDTRSLLDIPRLVERDRKPAPEVDAAPRLLDAARAGPPRAALFVAERVLSEWATNMPVVLKKLEAHVAIQLQNLRPWRGLAGRATVPASSPAPTRARAAGCARSAPRCR